MRCSYCTRRCTATFEGIPMCDQCMHAFVAGLMIGKAIGDLPASDVSQKVVVRR